MRHSVSQKLNLISLKLLSFSVSSHLMKKNPVLFHLMKKKSDSVSFHQKKTDSVLSHKKKILSHPGSVLNQNQNRTENSDSDDLK